MLKGITSLINWLYRAPYIIMILSAVWAGSAGAIQNVQLEVDEELWEYRANAKTVQILSEQGRKGYLISNAGSICDFRDENHFYFTEYQMNPVRADCESFDVEIGLHYINDSEGTPGWDIGDSFGEYRVSGD
jgi:hypothetical protein